MKQPYYKFEADENRLFFAFESENQGHVVQKLVEYVPIGGNVYNLAFGDADENGEINDLSVTNNKDMERVLATIIQTTLVFFETYPSKVLFFSGSTAARTRLYQIVIKREYQLLSERFVIEGIKDSKREQIQETKNYEAFLVKLKI